MQSDKVQKGWIQNHSPYWNRQTQETSRSHPQQQLEIDRRIYLKQGQVSTVLQYQLIQPHQPLEN